MTFRPSLLLLLALAGSMGRLAGTREAGLCAGAPRAERTTARET